MFVKQATGISPWLLRRPHDPTIEPPLDPRWSDYERVSNWFPFGNALLKRVTIVTQEDFEYERARKRSREHVKMLREAFSMPAEPVILQHFWNEPTLALPSDPDYRAEDPKDVFDCRFPQGRGFRFKQAVQKRFKPSNASKDVNPEDAMEYAYKMYDALHLYRKTPAEYLAQILRIMDRPELQNGKLYRYDIVATNFGYNPPAYPEAWCTLPTVEYMKECEKIRTEREIIKALKTFYPIPCPEDKGRKTLNFEALPTAIGPERLSPGNRIQHRATRSLEEVTVLLSSGNFLDRNLETAVEESQTRRRLEIAREELEKELAADIPVLGKIYFLENYLMNGIVSDDNKTLLEEILDMEYEERLEEMGWGKATIYEPQVFDFTAVKFRSNFQQGTQSFGTGSARPPTIYRASAIWDQKTKEFRASWQEMPSQQQQQLQPEEAQST